MQWRYPKRCAREVHLHTVTHGDSRLGVGPDLPQALLVLSWSVTPGFLSEVVEGEGTRKEGGKSEQQEQCDTTTRTPSRVLKARPPCPHLPESP